MPAAVSVQKTHTIFSPKYDEQFIQKGLFPDRSSA